jgi:hypothetical protein
MRTHLALLASAVAAAVVLSSGCGRTAPIVDYPERPSADIECGTQGPIPRTAFHLRIDNGFANARDVRTVTFAVRHRCMLRNNDSPPEATPGNCPRCFQPSTEIVTVSFEPGHPGIVNPAGWRHYRIENFTAADRHYAFEAVGAPSARYCVRVSVELQNGRVVNSDFATRLLTAAVHTDTEFRLVQDGSEPMIRREFVAEETPGNCAWA